jgi:hypothetical protein
MKKLKSDDWVAAGTVIARADSNATPNKRIRVIRILLFAGISPALIITPIFAVSVP